MLYSLWRVSLVEKNNGRIYFSIVHRKFLKFTLKEIQGILRHYYENISGKKSDLLIRNFAIPFVASDQSCSVNSSHQIRLWIILLVALIKLFFLVNSQMQFGKIISAKYQMLPFSTLPLFVVITEKCNGDLLRRACYKRLKSFSFFTRVIKTMELCTTELFIFEIKPSVKKNCYNGILKLRESEDIIAACSCPSGSSVKCLWKGNHVVADLFAWEDFNRKNLETFVEPLTCISQLSKCNFPRDSSTNLHLLMKPLIRQSLYRIWTEK